MNGQPPSTPYRVLARKYRPRGFDELIGQDAMVRTLRNNSTFRTKFDGRPSPVISR